MGDGCGLPVRRIVLIPGPNDFARDSGSPPCPAAVQNTGLCALWKELVPHLAQLPCPCGHHWRFGVANEFQFPAIRSGVQFSLGRLTVRGDKRRLQSYQYASKISEYALKEHAETLIEIGPVLPFFNPISNSVLADTHQSMTSDSTSRSEP